MQEDKEIEYRYTFEDDAESWTGEFTDYPADFTPEHMELVFDRRPLPDQVREEGNGLYLARQKHRLVRIPPSDGSSLDPPAYSQEIPDAPNLQVENDRQNGHHTPRKTNIPGRYPGKIEHISMEMKIFLDIFLRGT